MLKVAIYRLSVIVDSKEELDNIIDTYEWCNWTRIATNKYVVKIRTSSDEERMMILLKYRPY